MDDTYFSPILIQTVNHDMPLMKFTNVQPVSKEDNRSNMKNYWKIFICSVLVETIEKINYHFMQFDLVVLGLPNYRLHIPSWNYGITKLWNKSIHMFCESHPVDLNISKASKFNSFEKNYMLPKKKIDLSCCRLVFMELDYFHKCEVASLIAKQMREALF